MQQQLLEFPGKNDGCRLASLMLIGSVHCCWNGCVPAALDQKHTLVGVCIATAINRSPSAENAICFQTCA
jgi:hypothetical protein